MRIDKFLWAIRLFKTRSEASEACRLGRVRISGDIVKASKEVKIGDEISLARQGVTLTYKIKEILKNRVGAALVPQYVDDITSDEEKKKLALLRAPSFERRDPRTGRPTKRERREIDRFKGDDDWSGWDEDTDL